MLAELRIENFILIESLSLRLEPGFNVLTGETGAGKSIVIGALGLVLGGRARADMVRPTAKEACVEALFDLSAAPALRQQLEAMGVVIEDELVIRRTVADSGRSRAYLNGRLCTVAELGAIAGELADVTSQHASVKLADPSCHLEMLDRYAKLDDSRSALSKLVDELRDIVRELRVLNDKQKSRSEREDLLRYQIDHIDALDPHPGELDYLQSERNRLRHAEHLSTTSAQVAALLEGDEMSSASGLLDQLGRAVADIDALATLDDSVTTWAGDLDECWSRLKETARDLSRYAESIEADPPRLEEVQDRIRRLEEMLRRHGPTVKDAMSSRRAMQQELDDLATADERGPALEQRRGVLLSDAGALARQLSKKRRRAAVRLGKAISAELAELGMGAARVLIEVTQPACKEGGRESGELVVGGARLGREGIDRAHFLIAPNKGVDPRPLKRIASGGELSRALLALKRALRSESVAGVQVFDEVDSGVGGETADRIGRAIADIAGQRQVLCITHLASIAAHGDAHFVVTKEHGDDCTTTSISRVEGRTRVAEMARMLTGAKVTGPAKRAAKELLSAVRRAS